MRLGTRGLGPPVAPSRATCKGNRNTIPCRSASATSKVCLLLVQRNIAIKREGRAPTQKPDDDTTRDNTGVDDNTSIPSTESGRLGRGPLNTPHNSSLKWAWAGSFVPVAPLREWTRGAGAGGRGRALPYRTHATVSQLSPTKPAAHPPDAPPGNFWSGCATLCGSFLGRGSPDVGRPARFAADFALEGGSLIRASAGRDSE